MHTKRIFSAAVTLLSSLLVAACSGASDSNAVGEQDITGSGKKEATDGGSACGGKTCAAHEYCAAPEGSCSNEEGTCKALPAACPAVVTPVCGCDGKTYNNSCYAQTRGVSVASQGPCADGGGSDGGVAHDAAVRGRDGGEYDANWGDESYEGDDAAADDDADGGFPCPPDGTINCMPPTNDPLCAPATRAEVEAHCPGVSYLD